MSPYVNVQIISVGGGNLIYPTGTQFLDEGVVENDLLGLQRFPNSLKPFQEALNIYLRKDVGQFRNLLDNLRFSIEQLLRSVLGNERSLEKQRDAFLKWLADHGLHSSLVNMYNDLLFNGFAKYQNDAVKHAEKYEPIEIEFMIYMTGTFIRLILEAERG